MEMEHKREFGVLTKDELHKYMRTLSWILACVPVNEQPKTANFVIYFRR